MTAVSVHFGRDANDHALGNNRTTVYAPTTFYWTGRPRQRTILDSKVHRRRAYQPAEQHSPKRRRDIAIGGGDDGGSGLELGFEAPGISIRSMRETYPTLYRKKLRRVQPREGEKEWTWKGERCLDGVRRESSQIYFRARFISAMLIYPPDRRK